MELIARLGDREAKVSVERHGGRYVVRVDEAVYEVDAVTVGPSGRSYLIAGEQHEAGLRTLGNGNYEVASARGTSRVEVVDPLTYLAEESHAAGAGGAAVEVTAYMPGRVVEILVGEGDTVEAGQGVLVLEAMKMENEIQSERSGVVSRLLVEAGQAVESGDPLFEVS